jgi:hypothetical protein
VAGQPMMPLADRFWVKVLKTEGCWYWMAHRNRDGYGMFSIRSIPKYSHRVSWELAYGPIPEGQWVLHKCDNPACVRPDHLFLGDVGINTRDAAAKGRSGPHRHPRSYARDVRGERSPSAKLTAAQVVEIRSRYASGDGTLRSLGREYGIHNTTVGRIVKEESWQTVRWSPQANTTL